MMIIIIYYCNLVKLELSTNSFGINWESTKSRFLGNLPLGSTYSSCHHNYNKILKSDWLSTVLISALIGQFNRTVRVMPK